MLHCIYIACPVILEKAKQKVVNLFWTGVELERNEISNTFEHMCKHLYRFVLFARRKQLVNVLSKAVPSCSLKKILQTASPGRDFHVSYFVFVLII